MYVIFLSFNYTEYKKSHKSLYEIMVLLLNYPMNLWGVAVLELDSHPDHKQQGTRPRTLRLSKDPSHRS